MTNLPDFGTVWFRHLPFNIEEISSTSMRDLMPPDKEGFYLGFFDIVQANIFLMEEVDEAVKGTVLLHELIHGLLEVSGVQEHDEATIDAISFGLIDLLVTNKNLRDYFFQYINHLAAQKEGLSVEDLEEEDDADLEAEGKDLQRIFNE
jgi:hypothetical protein